MGIRAKMDLTKRGALAQKKSRMLAKVAFRNSCFSQQLLFATVAFCNSCILQLFANPFSLANSMPTRPVEYQNFYSNSQLILAIISARSIAKIYH
jgi:hypothetical protein